MSKASLESRWAWLPKHLLDSISDNLIPLSDYVRFSAVCVQWYSVAMDQKGRRMLPMLMIPTKDDSEEMRSLYDVFERKVYDFQFPVPYNKRCCGSSHGWLITVEDTMVITLLNPFLLSGGNDNAIIHLPPIIEFPKRSCPVEYSIPKVILSTDPALTPDDYVVVAIYGQFNRLAFLKSGDESWTFIDKERTLFSDVIYYKGQLHAVDHQSGVVLINTSSSSNETQVKTIIPSIYKYFSHTYLVESDENLLLVQRKLEQRDHALQWMTEEFKVYRLLQHPSGQTDHVEVKNLGGDALFLGDNHSMSVQTSKFSWCQPNSIYYTDDYIDVSPYFPFGPRDMGIFNLEDRSFGLHYTPNPSQKDMPPPLWIVPMFLKN